ncbi:hypothetical protein [Arthrobacter sp.]|uniref:hypothetical protein n=1 Tax=Arthrobacter sp. TaxID=1667 RepID=UPI00289E0C97|nr:hypothetical protein [Arthrobacter sp.]
MGRHRAEPVGERRGHRAPKVQGGRPRRRRNPELLGWGLFLTGTSAVCLLWAEVPAGLAAGSAALLLSAFLVAWYLSVESGTTAAPAKAAIAAVTPLPAAGAARAAETSRKTAKPAVPAVDSAVQGGDSVPAAVPAIPIAPAALQEFLPRPRPAASAVDGPSRWTRTFGPPETGSLPLQPYVPTRRTEVQTADPEGQDRRQRSHSSY